MIHRADPLHPLAVDERLDVLGEVFLLVAVLRLPGEHDGHPGGERDLDGAERVLLRRHAAEEGEVFARLEARLVGVEVDAVVDGGEFAPELHAGGVHLALADAGDGDARPAAHHPFVVEMRAGVHGEEALRAAGAGHGNPRAAEVVVDDVEVARLAQHLGHRRVRVILEHIHLPGGDAVGEVRLDGAVQARAGDAIAGGEERDLVAARDEFVDHQLHHQFDAAVGRGRDAGPERGDLGDAEAFGFHAVKAERLRVERWELSVER